MFFFNDAVNRYVSTTPGVDGRNAIMEHWWNDTGRWIPKCSKRNLTQYFVCNYPIWTCLGITPGSADLERLIRLSACYNTFIYIRYLTYWTSRFKNTLIYQDYSTYVYAKSHNTYIPKSY